MHTSGQQKIVRMLRYFYWNCYASSHRVFSQFGRNRTHGRIYLLHCPSYIFYATTCIFLWSIRFFFFRWYHPHFFIESYMKKERTVEKRLVGRSDGTRFHEYGDASLSNRIDGSFLRWRGCTYPPTTEEESFSSSLREKKRIYLSLTHYLRAKKVEQSLYRDETKSEYVFLSNWHSYKAEARLQDYTIFISRRIHPSLSLRESDRNKWPWRKSSKRLV